MVDAVDAVVAVVVAAQGVVARVVHHLETEVAMARGENVALLAATLSAPCRFHFFLFH